MDITASTTDTYLWGFDWCLSSIYQSLDEQLEEYILSFFDGDRELAEQEIHNWVLERRPIEVIHEDVTNSIFDNFVITYKEVVRFRRKTPDELEAEQIYHI